jgi:hypothetical protein
MLVTKFLLGMIDRHSIANKYIFAAFHFEHAKTSAGTMMVGPFYSFIFTKLGIFYKALCFESL